jgi:hypothetical protein
MKLLALLVVGVSVGHACDCREPSVRFKRDHAELIFRGIIVELRDSSRGAVDITAGFAHDTGKNVVFRVSRVWKGNVGQTFEMPGIEETSACTGFWPDYLRVGADLLVYALHLDGSQYITGICGGHKLAKDAKKDFRTLGRGREIESAYHETKSQ